MPARTRPPASAAPPRTGAGRSSRRSRGPPERTRTASERWTRSRRRSSRIRTPYARRRSAAGAQVAAGKEPTGADTTRATTISAGAARSRDAGERSILEHQSLDRRSSRATRGSPAGSLEVELDDVGGRENAGDDATSIAPQVGDRQELGTSGATASTSRQRGARSQGSTTRSEDRGVDAADPAVVTDGARATRTPQGQAPRRPRSRATPLSPQRERADVAPRARIVTGAKYGTSSPPSTSRTTASTSPASSSRIHVDSTGTTASKIRCDRRRRQRRSVPRAGPGANRTRWTRSCASYLRTGCGVWRRTAAWARSAPRRSPARAPATAGSGSQTGRGHQPRSGRRSWP